LVRNGAAHRTSTYEIIKRGTIAQWATRYADDVIQGLQPGIGTRPTGHKVGTDGEIFMDEESWEGLIDPAARGEKRFADEKEAE